MLQQGMNNMLGVAGLAGAYLKSQAVKSGVESAQNAGVEAKKAIEGGASARTAQNLLNAGKKHGQLAEVAKAQEASQKQLNEAIVANPGSLNDAEFEGFEGDISDFMTEGEQAAYQAEQIRQRDEMQAGSPEANPLTEMANLANNSAKANTDALRANLETKEQFREKVKNGSFKKPEILAPEVPMYSGAKPKNASEASYNMKLSGKAGEAADKAKEPFELPTREEVVQWLKEQRAEEEAMKAKKENK